MNEILIDDDEFYYLAYDLFYLNYSDSVDWEYRGLKKEIIDLFYDLKKKVDEREDLLKLKEYRESGHIDRNWVINYSKKQMDFIIEKILEDIYESVTEVYFEYCVEMGNCLLIKFGKSPLDINDIRKQAFVDI